MFLFSARPVHTTHGSAMTTVSLHDHVHVSMYAAPICSIHRLYAPLEESKLGPSMSMSIRLGNWVTYLNIFPPPIHARI